MGVDRGEWKFDLRWSKSESYHLRGCLTYQDETGTYDDRDGDIMAATRTRIMAEDPRYFTYYCHTSEQWSDSLLIQLEEDVRDEEFWNAESVVFEVVLIFFDCDYSRSFKRISRSVGKQWQMYESGALTDFVLVSSDKKELRTHRTVLAANCDAFEAMLTHDTQEKRTGICKFDDMDYDTLKVVVDSFYGGDVKEKLAEIPVKVFLAADKYGLKDLERLCHEPLIASIDITTCLMLYILACQHHGLDDLKRAAVAFVRSNFDDFVDVGGTELILKKAPELYRDFLKSCGPQKNTKKRSAAVAGIEEK